MGSVVKPAMVMGALMDGVITPTNNTLTDMPIKLAGTSSRDHGLTMVDQQIWQSMQQRPLKFLPTLT